MSHRDVSSVARVHMFTLGIDSQPHRVLVTDAMRDGDRKSLLRKLCYDTAHRRPHRKSSKNSKCIRHYLIDARYRRWIRWRYRGLRISPMHPHR